MTTAIWCSFLGKNPFDVATGGLGASVPAMFGSPVVAQSPSLAVLYARGVPAWRARRTGLAPNEPAPDLATRVAERGAPPSVLDDLAAVEAMVRPHATSVFVGRCFTDDEGTFAISVYRRDTLTLRVGIGEQYYAGFQVSGHAPSGTVVVEPHLLRRVCVNGATAAVRDTAHTYARWSPTDTEGDLATSVTRAMSGEVFPVVAADLARATAIRRPEIATLRARRLLRIADDVAAAIQRALVGEADSLFGLLQAITRVARDHRDLRTALSLERQAGRLVARLIDQPQDERAIALPLAPV
ncbi:MAG: hypothetical protein JNM10_02060 [Planctomycetia bacterium]|nr:hypothetical protein [Planctomycetia bacterium]